MIAALAQAGVACVGDIGDSGTSAWPGAAPGADAGPETGASTPGACGKVTPERRVWMLSRLEYDNTVASILGDTSNQARANLPPENRTNDFTSNATAEVVTTSTLNALITAAETIAANQASRQAGRLGCAPSDSPSASPADACIVQYIDSIGLRFFRRPLTPSEVDDMYSAYMTGFANPYTGVTPSTSGIQLLLTAFLEAPQFLYRTELGDPNDVSSPTVPMTQYEIASALAYVATAAPPDDVLLNAASAGKLDSPAALADQFKRLVSTPQGHQRVQQFILEWLGADSIGTLGKPNAALTPDIAAAMLTESQRYIDDVVYGSAGTLRELLTAHDTFVNAALAGYYGIAAGDSTSDFKKVSADASLKIGILSQGSFLASSATSGVPILHRGALLRQKLFCEQLPSVASLGLPNFTPPPLGTPGPHQTTRDLLTKTIPQGTACFACHQYFMPIGFGLDGFDAFGKFRTAENGVTVDTSGFIASSASVDPKSGLILDPMHATDTAFADYPTLVQTLAASAEVNDCFAEKLWVFASGRSDVAHDECELRDLQGKFVASGGNILSGLSQYFQSPSFTQRAR